jgi:preprotein translocase subunit YajC
MQPFLISLFFILLLVGGYYSFVFLPRQRAFKRHYELVTSIEIGQEIVTIGGLVGTVRRIDPDQGLVTLEVAPGVEVRVLAMAINQPFDPESLADSARRARS